MLLKVLVHTPRYGNPQIHGDWICRGCCNSLNVSTSCSFGESKLLLALEIESVRFNQATPLPYIWVACRCVCYDIHLGAAPLVCLLSLSERN
jgi:hypothetical protein